MDNNLSNVQNNQNKLIGWILGVVSIALSAFGWLFFLYLIPDGLYYFIPEKSWFGVMFFYFLVTLILGMIGLIIGIRQRKTESRFSVILGIVIPIVAIVLTIYFGFTVELSIILSTT